VGAGGGLLGVGGGGGRLPADAGGARGGGRRADRPLAVAIGAVAAVPVLLLGYAVLGAPWLLVPAVAAGAVALFANRPGH
jgi:hypothetical protein